MIKICNIKNKSHKVKKNLNEILILVKNTLITLKIKVVKYFLSFILRK